MKTPPIGIIYNEPLPEGTPNWESSADVLVQVEAIEQALVELGHASVRLPFTRDLAATVARIQAARIDRAFNLCESVDEDPLLIGHPAAVLELLGIPFTGSPAMALMLSTDKVAVKQLLHGAGIKTPAFFLYDGGEATVPAKLPLPVILKPRYQDASIGIDQDSVVSRRADLSATLKRFYTRYGPILVEEYVTGREFNISLFGHPVPRVMPLAEIDFTGLPDHLHRIVGYRAKWDQDSVEYRHTGRVFPDDLPAPLVQRMQRLAADCFRLFGLRDYGRIDLRFDEHDEPQVLEVNANPCLSPDAGFAAAVAESGTDYTGMAREFLCLLETRVSP